MFSHNTTNANVTSYRELVLVQKFEIVWMTLPEAAKALSILKHCGCKRWYKGRYAKKLSYCVMNFASVRGNVTHELFLFEAYIVTTNIFLFDILFVMICLCTEL